MPPFAPFPLTPSELVYLNGEQYAKKHLVNNVRLMHTEQSVSAGELAHAILATAFLASEAEGVLRLVPAKHKVLLGSREDLYAQPGSPGVVWPEPSLESKLLQLAQGLAVRSAHWVSDIVYHLLSENCTSPAAEIVDQVKPYLAARRLMDQEEKKTLGIFTTISYSLPAATVQGARQFPMARINQMLATAQQTRPEVWKLLMAGIKSGIARRVEMPSTDD